MTVKVRWGVVSLLIGVLTWAFPSLAEDIAIGGIYEACIGVTDPILQIRYWELLGYRIGEIGELSVADAKALYNVDSKLRSIRLYHLDADHGLVRLMVWDRATNDGLGMAKMLAPGSRWTSTMTRDVLDLFNHAEAAERAGYPIKIVPPQYSEIYDFGKTEPFVGKLMGVRELIILQPLTRNMFFERFGYELPLYGKINEAAKFQASQITHAGLVFQSDNPDDAKFYSDVLGLKAQSLERHTTYETLDQSSRQLYSMQPGERYFGSTFDNPRSGSKPGEAVSGRLLVRRIPMAVKEENLMHRSRPGCLGLSLYTYRVSGIGSYHAHVKAGRASGVTPILTNEFGERSFSFVAPDGHYWTLVGN
jgi:hypothetical protein